MFAIFYKKSTKHIVGFRHDQSTPAPQSAEFWFNIFLKDNREVISDSSDIAFIETAHKDFCLELGKQMWNETTEQVEVDPSYVAPTPSIEETVA